MAADTCLYICPPAVVVIEPWGMQRSNSGASLPSFCRFYKRLQEKENKKVYACHIAWLVVNLQDCWCYSSSPMETDGLNSRMVGRLRGRYQGPPFLTSYRTKTCSLKKKKSNFLKVLSFLEKEKRHHCSSWENSMFLCLQGEDFQISFCPNNLLDLLTYLSSTFFLIIILPTNDTHRI